MLIVESKSLDVYRNLAIEEYLMEHVTDQGPVLFLWRSDCAVVMGKNQNPWRECRLDRMRDENVPLARRISGGGTVYHDAGNLNYCVIVDRIQYKEAQAYEMVLQALASLGVRAEKTGKSNMSVGGLKFSGNAFCFRKGRALHHGTLLLNTDLKQLNRYLGPFLESIETHAIGSVPADVTNLGLEVGVVSDALRNSFQASYLKEGHLVLLADTDLKPDLLTPLVEKQMANDWTFGATPRFTIDSGDLHLEVEKGRVVAAAGPLAGQFLDKPFSIVAFSLACDVD